MGSQMIEDGLGTFYSVLCGMDGKVIGYTDAVTTRVSPDDIPKHKDGEKYHISAQYWRDSVVFDVIGIINGDGSVKLYK